MNKQFETSQENGLSAILEAYSAHLEGTVLSQRSVVKAGWLVYCVTIRSHSRIRWHLTETFGLRVIKMRFLYGMQKLHFLWIRFSQLELPASVAPCMMQKVLTRALPRVHRARSLPTPSFDSIFSYTDFCLDFSCIGGGGATFQSPSLQPVQIKGIKNSWTNIRKANTKVVSAWFLLETYTKTSFQAAAARRNMEKGYDNPMPSCLTASTPRKHHS